MGAQECGNGGDSGDSEEDLFAVFDAPVSSGSSLPVPTTAFHNFSSLSPSVFSNYDTTLLASSKTTPVTSAPIMHVVSATSRGDWPNSAAEAQQQVQEEKDQQKEQTGVAIVRERNSAINISRPTRSFEQLSVILAQFSFSTFADLHRTFAVAGALPTAQSVTVIGAVVKKTDPKQKNGKHSYSVIHLWNMQGPFPTPAEELHILFVGSAFDVHYTRLASGVVLALSGAQVLDNRRNAQYAAAADFSTGSSKCSRLLKVANSEQVRFLGYAADFGTCQGTQRRSGERCNSIVNAAVSKFCSQHMSDLRRGARGGGTRDSPIAAKSIGVSGPVAAHFSALARPNVLASCSTALARSEHGTLRTLLRQQQGFLTVKGSCGLPTTTPTGSDVTFAAGEYAGVVANGTLPLTGICRDVARVYKSPLELGVSSRGRVVLAAAADQEDAGERQRLLQRAMRPAMKRFRDEDLSCGGKSATASVRAEFAPLGGGSSSTSFAPMRCSGFDEVCIRGKDYQNRIITKRSNGTTSAIVSAVEQRLRTEDGVFLKAALTSRKKERVGSNGKAPHTGCDASTENSTLLGAVSMSMQSANDDMRAADERRRFEQRMQRRIMQDKAFEALCEVTEQAVTAFYCRQCERWYMRRNERCKMLQHSLELKETARRFIECEHCGYKTSVLGDVRPSRLIPRCPRCCADVTWRASNAAPEVAAEPKDGFL